MPRVSKGPRYYPSKGQWFANINKVRYPLIIGPQKETEAEAKRLYNLLVNEVNTTSEADSAPCSKVLLRWLHWSVTRIDPPPIVENTFRINKRFVESFIEGFGTIAVKDLRRHHFDEWLSSKTNEDRFHSVSGRRLTWNEGTRRMALAVLGSAFEWASTIGDLTTINPFKVAGNRIKRKRISYKGKKIPVEFEEHRMLMEYASGRAHHGFAYLLLFWWATGARPAEVHQLKGEEWNEDIKAFVIDPETSVGRYKLARFKEQRVIYIPDELLEFTRFLVKQTPKGHLFLNEKGAPWTSNSINKRFDMAIRYINKKAGKEVLSKNLSPYSYRHSFVTRWMQSPTADVKHLATLLNTSITQLESTYSHLFKKHETLRDSLNRFTAESCSKETTPADPS